MPPLASNKKALHDYEFLEKFEGGLKLTGPEVRSVKDGHIQLQGSFLHIRNRELWLKNATVSKYAPAGPQLGYDPIRDKKVLLHRREINRIMGKIQEKGLTLVPISVYTHAALIKIEFALARGKKQYEKRETIKKRDVQREMRARMKG
ncbi:SsrA-binding protein SmpB [bacterium]|nr:SsrA-binding protein SmpB [bacterium]